MQLGYDNDEACDEQQSSIQKFVQGLDVFHLSSDWCWQLYVMLHSLMCFDNLRKYQRVNAGAGGTSGKSEGRSMVFVASLNNAV